MEDVEKWSDSGSILKAAPAGVGNTMDVWCVRKGIQGRD